jgi:outer membrane lipoprotein SlyB
MSAEQQGTAGATGGMAGSMDQSQGASGAMGATAAGSTPNATVVSIETVPRQAGAATGAGAMAGAAVGGSTAGATGSSMPDHVYRVMLRMDDGTTKVVTQETTPSYRAGDRINLTSGVIQH